MRNRVKKSVVNDELDVHGGFSRGWVGLSALSEGKIQDVIFSLNEVVGETEIIL